MLRDRVVLNLGRVLAGEGRIPDDVAGRAAETARRLTDLAVRMGADHVVPLATSALRDSPGREALEALFEGAIGTDVRFIDGREEARLTFAGVTASVALGEGPTPARPRRRSLEVALAGPEGLRWGRSLPIGAGRMTGLVVARPADEGGTQGGAVGGRGGRGAAGPGRRRRRAGPVRRERRDRRRPRARARRAPVGSRPPPSTSTR